MSAPSYRRSLLVAALVCLGLFVGWLLLPLLGERGPVFAKWGVVGTPLTILPVEGSAGVVLNNTVFLGLLLLTQWAFLRPVRRTAWAGNGGGRPRWHAAVGVAFAAALLVAAAGATLLELPNWWKVLLAEAFGWTLWVVFGALWAAWSVVFYVYFRRGDFLGRAEGVVRALIRGSALELLVAVPTHAWVYRRSTSDCYCERGSYTGLVFGGAALLWAFGPGLVFLFLREKERRAPVLQRLCPQCGAVLEPAAAAGTPCPRCGRVATA